MIAKIYNMSIPSSVNNGKRIGEILRLAEGESNIQRFFRDEVIINYVGVLEYEYLFKGPYIYSRGKIQDLEQRYILTDEEFDNVGDKNHFLVNCLMREFHGFATALWLVKDNSVKTEMGFIRVNEDDGPLMTSTGTGFSVTTADGQFLDINFTNEELSLATEYFNKLFTVDSDLGKRITQDPYEGDASRISRALYFLQRTRYEAHVPVKIMNYCMILECLFTKDSSSINHKIAERFSKIMGKTLQEKQELFKFIKYVYIIRSQVAHGQKISSKKLANIKEQSVRLDELIRKLFVEILFGEYEGIFEKDDNELEEWFNELILN
jgi:hypothetical protein